MSTKFLSVLVVTALLFVSCNSKDDMPEENDVMVKFSSGVSTLQTKVGGDNGDEWGEDDEIGIFMKSMATETISQMNRRYSISYLSAEKTTANFISQTPIYYPSSGERVEFLAYYPYDSAMQQEGIINLENQGDQAAIDLMFALANNGGVGYNKDYSGVVGLKFNHLLSKVIVNVSTSTSVPSLNGLSVTIHGMNTEAFFGIDEGTISDPKNQKPIILKEREPAVFEAIVLPEAISDQYIEFKINGNSFKWKIANASLNRLDRGFKYTFNITLEANDVLASASIQKWTSNNFFGTAKP